MNKEQESIEYKVGFFCLIGIVTLGICIFLLGGDSSIFTEYYQLSLKLKNVQGVQSGSIVSVAGVKVGNITNIHFLPEENVLQVKIRIEQKYQDRIRQNAKASLKTRGVLGDQYIYIEPGSYDFPALQPGDEVRIDDSGDLLGKIGERGNELENIFEILKEVKVLMQRINGEGRSDEIMANFADSSKTLKETITETRKLLLDLRSNLPNDGELKTSVNRLSSILKKVDEGQGTLGSLINDPSIYQRLSTLLGGEKRPQYLKSLIRESIQTNEKSGQK